MTEQIFEAGQHRRIVVLDIETVAIDPKEQKGALESLSGRIVCVGLLFADGHSATEIAIADEDERRLLRQFWSAVNPSDVFVGHNILEFDLPFIRQRSWIHNVPPSRPIDMRRFYTHDVIDTMQVWGNWGFGKKVSLDALARVLGVGRKTARGT